MTCRLLIGTSKAARRTSLIDVDLFETIRTAVNSLSVDSVLDFGLSASLSRSCRTKSGDATSSPISNDQRDFCHDEFVGDNDRVRLRR